MKSMQKEYKMYNKIFLKTKNVEAKNRIIKIITI